MLLEGDIQVLSVLKEKKRLLEVGEAHEHVKSLVVIDGGFMQGAYAVGAGLASEELDYTQAFSHVVGVPVGWLEVGIIAKSPVGVKWF